MIPAEHKAEAERLLKSVKRDELELQGRRRATDDTVEYAHETANREREVNVLIALAAVHATLAAVPA